MPSRSVARLLAAAASLLTLTNAIPTITSKGSKFFTSEGNQWYIKGAAYQLLPNDPLIDTEQCTLDAALMQELGANAIRVYHVDASADHDGCMAAFEAAGIYTFVDLDTFSSYIVQDTPEWTAAQMGAYRFVMDAFQKYDNVAGFFIGNEIINSVGTPTLAAPYIKAATADLKAYAKAAGYRNIPIGYSHADVAGLRPALQDYFVCGDDSSQTIDFFGLNCYEWCGDATFETSGYIFLQNQTYNYPVPIFMSETGCNVPEPRTFGDQSAIFGEMVDTWSGAIIYEWIQEENHYGLITYGGGNTDALNYAAPAGGYSRSGTPTPVSPDFYNLKTQWASYSPTGVAEAAYTPSFTAPACPASTAGQWEVNGDVPLPTLGVNVVIPTSLALSMANYDYTGAQTVPAGALITTTSAAAVTSSDPPPVTTTTGASSSYIPVASSSSPLAASPSPLASSSSPVASSPFPLATSTTPVAPSSSPLATSSSPVASSDPTTASAVVAVTTSDPPTSSSTPVAASSDPPASSSTPVASSSTPVASSSPVATSSTPVATSTSVLIVVVASSSSEVASSYSSTATTGTASYSAASSSSAAAASSSSASAASASSSSSSAAASSSHAASTTTTEATSSTAAAASATSSGASISKRVTSTAMGLSGLLVGGFFWFM